MGDHQSERSATPGFLELFPPLVLEGVVLAAIFVLSGLRLISESVSGLLHAAMLTVICSPWMRQAVKNKFGGMSQSARDKLGASKEIAEKWFDKAQVVAKKEIECLPRTTKEWLKFTHQCLHTNRGVDSAPCSPAVPLASVKRPPSWRTLQAPRVATGPATVESRPPSGRRVERSGSPSR